MVVLSKSYIANVNVLLDINSQYETGVISLTAEVLIKLSDFYGVSIDYLLDRTDNPDIVK